MDNDLNNKDNKCCINGNAVHSCACCKTDTGCCPHTGSSGETLNSAFVNNNACTGTDIEFILKNFEKLVDNDDDLVICMIGTNNRHQFFVDAPKHTPEEHLEGFYQNILRLHRRFLEEGKRVIFMAGTPASAENEKDGEDYWRLFHMADVCAAYKKASEERGFPLISLYDLFLDYCKAEKITVDSLLCDGLHPNDTGYEVMFKLVKQALFENP